jgi:phenylalanyl-tRNA synthetase beta chain
MVISGVVSGPVVPAQWGQASRPVDFFDIKGHVEALLDLTGHADQFRFRNEPDPVLHPGQSAVIVQDQLPVGRIGALHPAVESALGLSQQAYVFEISADILREANVPAYQPLSRYPSIRRDIAVVVDQDLPATSLLDCIRLCASEYLTNVELFDVYMGEGIDSGRKSLALGLTLQDLSRTLKDKEVEAELNHILSVLNSELGATLRE